MGTLNIRQQSKKDERETVNQYKYLQVITTFRILNICEEFKSHVLIVSICTRSVSVERLYFLIPAVPSLPSGVFKEE